MRNGVESSDWQTTHEIISAAHARLPREVWHYVSGGSESEATLRRNRSAFESIAFRSRVLRAAGRPDIQTTLLGHEISAPVFLAPVGGVSSVVPDGALAVARAAAEFGTITCVATSASPSVADIRAFTRAPLIFQLSMLGDRAWVTEMIARAVSSGCLAICLTADVPVVARRERVLHLRMFPAGRREAHRPNIVAGADYDREGDFSWDDVEWLRSATTIPLILKGVQTAEDAEMAVDRGIDVVYVSNHGGRQLDHAPATIEVLPEIVAAVQGRSPVLVDSGFVRGSDVVKALAMGATAVGIGKLMMWGLAAGGEAGLTRALQILAHEVRVTMSLIGARTIDEITPHSIRVVTPPAQVPWPLGLGSSWEDAASGPTRSNDPASPSANQKAPRPTT